MSGSEAGTKYKAFMKSAAKAGEALGVSFVDANNKLLSMPEILEKIGSQYGSTIDAIEKLELQQAFGRIEGLEVVDLLMPKLTALKGNISSLSGAMQGGTSVTEQMALSMNKDLGAQLTLLKQRFQNTFQTLGKTVLPIVASIVDKISSAVLVFNRWAQAHPDLLKLGMGVLMISGAVLTAAGGLTLIAGTAGFLITNIIQLAAAIGIGAAGSITFTTALGGLAGALWAVISPILPIIAAVGLLYLAWKTNFLGIQDTVFAVWTAVKAVFNSFKPVLSAVKTFFVSAFGAIISAVSNWFTSFNSNFTGARAPLLVFAGWVAYALGFTLGVFKQVFGWIGPFSIKAFNAVKDGIGSGVTAIIGFWNFLKTNTVAIISHTAGTISSIMGNMWKSITSIFTGGINWLIDKINWIGTQISSVSGIIGIELPVIPRLPASNDLIPKMNPARLGVELYDFTDSDTLVKHSPWTVKTSSALIGAEVDKPLLPMMKAVIDPVFKAIPVIKVFAEVVFLKPFDELANLIFAAPAAPAPAFSGNAGTSVVNHSFSRSQSSQSNYIDRRIGPVTINVKTEGGDPNSVVRVIEDYFNRLASQADGIEGVTIDA